VGEVHELVHVDPYDPTGISRQFVLVVDVDGRGWARLVVLPQATGYVPQDYLTQSG